MTSASPIQETPLYQLLNQINAAASGGLHLLAISMAASVPAICASLGNANARSKRDDYKAWCRANLSGPEFSFVTPDDLYSMRCGVLHQGRFGGLVHNVERIIFIPPGPVTMSNCKADDTYLYSVVEFCRNICDAAHRWCEEHIGEPVVAANMKRMMQYHPNGLAPFIQGFPVIA